MQTKSILKQDYSQAIKDRTLPNQDCSHSIESSHKQDCTNQSMGNNAHNQDCYNLQEHCKETAKLLAKFEESTTVEVEVILISRLWLTWTVC